MKLFLNISADQTKPVKRIISCQRNNKRPALVILNTDYDYGKYVKSLAKIMNGLGMVERSKFFRSVSLKQIQTGDFIVIGNENPWEDYDFEVMTDQQQVESLDGRRFKRAYDIIDDWKEIVKKLTGYGVYNASRVVNDYDPCDEYEQKSNFIRPVGINMNTTTVRRETECVCREKLTVTSQYRPFTHKEKVTIFQTWVKIGFNQYDIYVDLFGNKHITLEGGQKLYVVEDRYGRSFLVKR